MTKPTVRTWRRPWPIPEWPSRSILSRLHRLAVDQAKPEPLEPAELVTQLGKAGHGGGGAGHRRRYCHRHERPREPTARAERKGRPAAWRI